MKREIIKSRYRLILIIDGQYFNVLIVALMYLIMPIMMVEQMNCTILRHTCAKGVIIRIFTSRLVQSLATMRYYMYWDKEAWELYTKHGTIRLAGLQH